MATASHCFMSFDDTIVQVREEELRELDELLSDVCELPVAGGCENSYGKVNILLQSFISRHRVDCFSLVSDQAYVAQVSLSVVSRHRVDCFSLWSSQAYVAQVSLSVVFRHRVDCLSQ